MLEIAPAYKLHEVWQLPFDLTVALLAAHRDRLDRANDETRDDDCGYVPQRVEVEGQRFKDGSVMPDWFARLKAAVGG